MREATEGQECPWSKASEWYGVHTFHLCKARCEFEGAHCAKCAHPVTVVDPPPTTEPE